VAREIVHPFREQGVNLIGFSGCYPNAYSHKMMERLCTHPNVGGALLVSLGCEGFNKSGLLETVRKSGRPARLAARSQNAQSSAQRAAPGPIACCRPSRSTARRSSGR
jgi:altronate dehydratase